LTHRVERVLEVNVDDEYTLFQALCFARDPVELKLVKVNASFCSSAILARSNEIFRFHNDRQPLVDHVVH
jgi:hypothetical protein